MGTVPAETGVRRLSRRELEVARLVAEGLTNREISQRLFISERTVDGHLEHVREKLAVNTRAQVAAWVVRNDTVTAHVPPVEAVHAAPHRWAMAHPRMWMATALVLALLAAGVGVLRLTAPPEPVIETFAGIQTAGQPTGGNLGDFYPAIHAQLYRPTAMAVAGDGTVYIADYGSQRVFQVTRNGLISRIAGGGTGKLLPGAFATDVAIGDSSSIAIDRQGRLYFLTVRASHLEVWSLQPPDRTLSLVASLGASNSTALYGHRIVPLGGLVVAGDATLYIADRAANQVWKVAQGGQPTLYAGTGAPGYGGDLGPATSARLYWPMGLALDELRGDLYVADSLNNRIRKIDSRGIITTVVGVGGYYNDGGDNGPARQAHLGLPFGVALSRDGSTLYIADTANNRVRQARDGLIRPLAGRPGGPGFGGDGGLAGQATLSGPEAVAVDQIGDLLIADTENNLVRIVRHISK